MSAPQTIIRLVETFRNNIESLKSGNYNETQARREFIDPFFDALGWDVFNKNGYAEAYKDVIHEYSQKTTDTTKNPDYCFRIGGKRKFFVEAKKPSINLKDDIHPAYQLRRYGWSAKLPLCILTDFEEFAVYDCRVTPKKNDKASTARIMFLTYENYIDKWDELVNIFSKDAVLKGSFDKYAESNKKKRGTADVDEAFLKEMEEWRNLLARNIALRNSNLSIRELNYAVQKTIDRLIFLRICEDRGIENYGQLMNLLNGTNVYKRLNQIFTRADEKYNSGLFHFEKEKDRNDPPDEITPALQIDDKTLKDIIKKLYYPESPYEFSVLPADILGHVYEQFLGKVIRLTPAHYAVVEDKPEVKKAGGVYYTPTYIVDYIVKNTVGKILEKKTPKQVTKISILDPACGSGSFLIGAYQYLLDWHLKFYTNNVERISDSLKKKKPPIYQIRNNEYTLTTTERKRILLNNIYGVDIDSQAVEVTKLSLLLKVLEGESEEILQNQFKMFRERALPDLANNIKCGNSLIGPDFYDQMEMNFLDDEEKLKINVFDWEAEFPDIFNVGGSAHQSPKKEGVPVSRSPKDVDGPVRRSLTDEGGFDIVIGNPPWIDIKGMDPTWVDYYFKKYSGTSNRMNIYATFIEKSILLLSKHGSLGFITPISFYTQSSFENLRFFILKNVAPIISVRLPDNVFKNVKAESIITIFKKGNLDKCVALLFQRTDKINFIENNKLAKRNVVKIKNWKNNSNNIFNIYLNDKLIKLLNKIEEGKTQLSQICNFCLGITPYDKYKGHNQTQIKNKVFHSSIKKDASFNPLLTGGSINRFSVIWDEKHFISYGPWLGAPREKRFFTKPRILIRQIVSGNPLQIYCAFTDKEYYNTQTIFNLLVSSESDISLKYLLAILNSKLMTFYHRNKFLDQSKSTFQKILIQDAKQFPIVFPIGEDNNFTVLYNHLINHSDTIMLLKEKLNKSKTPTEQIALQRQIDATDKQIDKLVYKLYALTEEEIRIVEEM